MEGSLWSSDSLATGQCQWLIQMVSCDSHPSDLSNWSSEGSSPVYQASGRLGWQAVVKLMSFQCHTSYEALGQKQWGEGIVGATEDGVSRNMGKVGNSTSTPRVYYMEENLLHDPQEATCFLRERCHTEASKLVPANNGLGINDPKPAGLLEGHPVCKPHRSLPHRWDIFIPKSLSKS